MSKIVKSLSDLDKEGFRHVFQTYFETQDVEIIENEDLSDLEGKGAHFVSEVMKTSVKLKTGDEEKTFNIVIKFPADSFFVRQMGKIGKPFMREVLWYRLVKTFEGEFPELRGELIYCI